LENLTHLLVIDNGTVASKVFLKLLQDLLCVILFGKALESCYSFTSVTLLDTNICTVKGLENRQKIAKMWNQAIVMNRADQGRNYRRCLHDQVRYKMRSGSCLKIVEWPVNAWRNSNDTYEYTQ
jgi:hypothetical protein